jgi:uncharacterized protein YdhG (YjbR/CyaY superfamily)
MKKSAPENIEAYIAQYPENVQLILQRIRRAIKKAAPDAQEAIRYQIPTFRMGGNLVHFAAFSGHISFFPTSSGVERFSKQLAKYETSKGTIRFDIEKPIPYELISRITRFRVGEMTRKDKRRS